MGRIRFTGAPDKMGAQIIDGPVFPGGVFGVGMPESIGATDYAKWFDVIRCTWLEREEGRWLGRGWVDGEFEYTVDVTPQEDYVDFLISITNKSGRAWRETFAFNCFQAGGVADIRDHDCKRHWVRSGGEFRRLIELPRVFGPRPTIQLYTVEGAPSGKDIPFVEGFHATPDDVAIEGWMAICSRDGKRLVATVSRSPLFTFQNREYSCIHSAPTFGPMAAGASAKALTRLYFVEATLETWYQRMKEEFAGIVPADL